VKIQIQSGSSEPREIAHLDGPRGGVRLAHGIVVRSFVLLASLLVAIGWGVVQLVPHDADADVVAHAVRPQQIESISIEGRGVPVAALRELLASKAGELLDDSLLARDRDALRDALVARGYLAAHVAAAHITYDTRGAAFVTFAITKGPLYRVRSVQLTGATEKDAGVVTIASGDPAESERISVARAAIAARLEARGKHLGVTADVRADDAAAVVDVVLAAK
jgi:outer membrane protein assembly factor BamA